MTTEIKLVIRVLMNGCRAFRTVAAVAGLDGARREKGKEPRGGQAPEPRRCVQASLPRGAAHDAALRVAAVVGLEGDVAEVDDAGQYAPHLRYHVSAHAHLKCAQGSRAAQCRPAWSAGSDGRHQR